MNYGLVRVCVQTESHGHLLDLSDEKFLGVPNVRQRFIRAHPVNLEVHVLRDDCMCPVSRDHQAIFVEYRHDLNHRFGFIHQDRFLRYPVRLRIPVRKRIEVEAYINTAYMIQDVVVCQAAFSVYSGLVPLFINTMAFDCRCIPARCVARRLKMTGILVPRALRPKRLGHLGASPYL